jgi:hypothetical protein
LVLASPQRPTTVRHLNPPRGQRSRRSVDRTRSPFEPNPISVRGDARDMREHLSIAFSAERGCRRPPYPPHRRGGGRPVVSHERCGRATELDVFRLAAAPGRTFLPSPEDARLSSREASCLGTGDRYKRPSLSTRGTRSSGSRAAASIPTARRRRRSARARSSAWPTIRSRQRAAAASAARSAQGQAGASRSSRSTLDRAPGSVSRAGGLRRARGRAGSRAAAGRAGRGRAPRRPGASSDASGREAAGGRQRLSLGSVPSCTRPTRPVGGVPHGSPLSSGGGPLARPARGSGAGNSGRLRPGPTRAPSPVGYACRFARPAVPWRQAR